MSTWLQSASQKTKKFKRQKTMLKNIIIAYAAIVTIATSALVVAAVVELNTPNQATAQILNLVK